MWAAQLADMLAIAMGDHYDDPQRELQRPALDVTGAPDWPDDGDTGTAHV